MLSTLNAARRDKSQTENCCNILLRADTNFKWFSMVDLSCTQTLAVAVQRVWCRHGVIHLSRRNKKQPQHPIKGLPLLEFSPALESWSDIYTGPTSCLIIPQMFSSLVFYPPPLSFCRSAQVMHLRTERSLLHISRHTPYAHYCWLATSLFWYSALTHIPPKNCIPHL